MVGPILLRYQMNKLINKVLLAEYKFLTDRHLLTVIVNHLLKRKKNEKKLKKQVIRNIFIKR